MEVLVKAPEYYIQQCGCCGTVLKYSKCDIHIANKPFEVENGNECTCSFDAIICPSCGNPIEAKREWLIEIGWIKNLLESAF